MRSAAAVCLLSAWPTMAWAGGPGLEVSPLVPGGPVTFRAPPSPAGARVYVVGGSRISPGAFCPSSLRGRCLDLANAFIVGNVTVPPSGVASLTVNVPASATGPDVAFQAVAFQAGVVLGTTAAVRVDVLDPLGDLDQDGLAALQEVLAGADPRNPDTDGGGIADGQEVQLDGTDPTDGGDDIPGERLCDNDIDDDLDTRFDCGDTQCGGSCPELDCTNGIDDDGDGATDCADTTCKPLLGCGGETRCDDGRDNDRNGLIDCEDLSCLDDPVCMEADCADGVDDDGDGFVDCEDDDCWSPDCQLSTLTWVTAFSGSSNGRELFDEDAAGSVFTSTTMGGRFCHFSVFGIATTQGVVSREVVNVDPACRVTQGFLPSTLQRQVSTIPTWSGYTSTATRWTDNGRHWYGTWFENYNSVFSFRPSDAAGSCGAGARAPFFRDDDLDGFGASGDELVTGQTRHTAYACRAWPGVVTASRDCDDTDPTWIPSSYSVSQTCRFVGPDDRDGDGVPTASDADDTNSAVR